MRSNLESNLQRRFRDALKRTISRDSNVNDADPYRVQIYRQQRALVSLIEPI